MTKASVFIIMGVSGCGKSTIGKLLAAQLHIPFFDGDDYHPEVNVQKMVKGIPLNDNDRKSWLEKLNELAKGHIEKGAVIACSALKEAYRNQLKKQIEDQIEFVYLEGSFEEILERLQQRKGHFMPVGLLKSQFDTLEPPKDAITVPITDSPEHIVSGIIKQYETKKP